MGLSARAESYRLWRQRLAERQEELRVPLDEDSGPTVNPEWSPEALFATSRDEVSIVPDGDPTTAVRADHGKPLVEAPRSGARSPPPTPPSPPPAAPARSTAPPALVDARMDARRVIRASTSASRRVAPSLADRLRDLNGLRVEGAISEDQFNRRKVALFAAAAHLRSRRSHRDSGASSITVASRPAGRGGGRDLTGARLDGRPVAMVLGRLGGSLRSSVLPERGTPVSAGFWPPQGGARRPGIEAPGKMLLHREESPHLCDSLPRQV